jgi:hypothetical protein
LQQFQELCSTFTIRGVEEDVIRLWLFLFSLLSGSMWTAGRLILRQFLAKFFSLGKTNALRGSFLSFQQATNETILEAWEREASCPHHRMDNWLILQNFYNGLTLIAQWHVDAAVGGDFFSLTIANATKLIDKMISNQGWSDDRLQPRQRDTDTVKEADMLNAKMDL